MLTYNLALVATEVTFFDCDISSMTGRGVVATRGATVTLNQCRIHKCAATGVYIGGEGTTGEALNCEVTSCGLGGERILRGHSGIRRIDALRVAA